MQSLIVVVDPIRLGVSTQTAQLDHSVRVGHEFSCSSICDLTTSVTVVTDPDTVPSTSLSPRTDFGGLIAHFH